MALATVPYQTRTPQSIQASSHASPHPHHFPVDEYGGFYQPSTYDQYSQVHRFAPQSPVAQQQQQHSLYAAPSYATHSYPQGQQTQPTLGTQMPPVDTSSFGRQHEPSVLSSAHGGFSPVLDQNSAQQHRRSSSTARNVSPTGPIKAAGPIIPRKDADGKTWITVEYTKDRVVKSHAIRIDIHHVDVDALPYEFKLKNVVYPAVFKGTRRTRQKYEDECNRTAWALTKLNPILETSKGLRQRAVDHWRNSNEDQNKASRRVRREAKKLRRVNQTNALNLRPLTEPVDGGLPSMAGTLPRHSIDSGDTAASFARRYSRQLMTGQQQGSLNNILHQSGDGDSSRITKSFQSAFHSPILRSIFPPTPDTISNDAHSDTSRHSHVAGAAAVAPSSSYGTKERNNSVSVHSHRASFTNSASDNPHYRVNVHTDGPQEHHFSNGYLERTSVFPRAIRASHDDTGYGRYEEASPTQTSVPVRLGSAFNEMIAVPLASTAQQQRDRYWNDRAADLVRSRHPELKTRPQSIQRLLTSMYRKGSPSKPAGRDSSPWIVQNRPGIHA